MAQLAVHGPLDECDLHDDLGPHPVRAQARQSRGLRERRLRDLESVEPGTQVEQQLGVEAGADLAGKDEVVAVEVADKQRAETDAAALRIGEAADNKLLRGLALHLEPVRRPPVLVRRVAALGDDAFPALAARALPRLRLVERRRRAERRAKRQRSQQGASLVERQRRHVAAVQPEDVEDVIGGGAAPQVISPSRITSCAGRSAIGVGDRRDVLRQPIA